METFLRNIGAPELVSRFRLDRGSFAMFWMWSVQ